MNIKIPYLIYEHIPFLYVVLGLLCLVTGEFILGLIGICLFISAYKVSSKRTEYRLLHFN